MKIKAYDIILLKTNNFFLIRNIFEDRISGSISKVLYANGFTIKSDKYTLEELQTIEPKKLIQECELEKVEKINLEDNIKAIISNKKRAEWRLNKKVLIL